MLYSLLVPKFPHTRMTAYDPGCVETPDLIWFFVWSLRGDQMKRFIEGADRDQATLLPECLEDWVEEDNPVRAIDAFIDALNLGDLGF